MAGQHGVPGVAERLEAVGGAALLGEVVAEDREAMVVEPAREVGHVGAEDEIADLDGLMAGRVSGRQQQADRTVAEEIVVAVDELDRPIGVGVVAREVEVAPDRGVVVPGGPLGCAGRRPAPSVGTSDSAPAWSKCRWVSTTLVSVVRSTWSAMLSSCSSPNARGPGRPVEGAGVGDRRGVQPGVDQDPLGRGLDEVGRDGEADRLVRARRPRASGLRSPSANRR